MILMKDVNSLFLKKRVKKNTEKEGFEPSHRANGLYP